MLDKIRLLEYHKIQLKEQMAGNVTRAERTGSIFHRYFLFIISLQYFEIQIIFLFLEKKQQKIIKAKIRSKK